MSSTGLSFTCSESSCSAIWRTTEPVQGGTGNWIDGTMVKSMAITKAMDSGSSQLPVTPLLGNVTCHTIEGVIPSSGFHGYLYALDAHKLV